MVEGSCLPTALDAFTMADWIFSLLKRSLVPSRFSMYFMTMKNSSRIYSSKENNCCKEAIFDYNTTCGDYKIQKHCMLCIRFLYLCLAEGMGGGMIENLILISDLNYTCLFRCCHMGKNL